ncbi:MAG: ABC transporter ATP-binding protein [Ruegeria sp.]|uniref:ABC transporter ATP-binding protein n=1 Tax=Ruegeria sp. TaxID=1879320 RepID=UPI00349E4F2D
MPEAISAQEATGGLSVRDLSFRYGAKTALDAVSLDVAPGCFCALLGPNGAGKSTLIALLTRLLVAPGGDIRIAGHDLRAAPRRALADLGVVFQQPTLDLNLTVRQNLAYFAALHGLPRAETPGRIDAALDRLGMRERADEKARALNGGHRRRMELARALLHDPKVLLLDEPTVGLDAAARQSITDHVHDLADQGLCVLWTTHLTDEVRDTDHLLVLHQGRILADGTTGEIRGDTPLSDWFLSKTSVQA